MNIKHYDNTVVTYTKNYYPISAQKDKQSNVIYWDQIDQATEHYLMELARLGGVNIKDIHDYGIVKELVACSTTILQNYISAVSFPYIEEEQ